MVFVVDVVDVNVARSFAAPQVQRPFASLPDMTCPRSRAKRKLSFHVFQTHVSELIWPRRQIIWMELIRQRRWTIWMMTRLRRPQTQTSRGVDVAEGGAICSCDSAAAAGQPDSPVSRVRRRLPQTYHEASWWQRAAQLHGRIADQPSLAWQRCWQCTAEPHGCNRDQPRLVTRVRRSNAICDQRGNA